MIALAHLLLVAVYAAGPAAAGVWAVAKRRRPSGQSAGRRLRRAIVGGLAIAGAACSAYWVADRVPPRAGQVVLAAYWATSFLLLLGLIDAGLWQVTQRLFRLGPGPVGGRGLGGRVAAAVLLRAAVAAGFVLPYVLAAAVTYRPKSSPTTDPARRYGWAFEPVTFPATDGTRIAGWWIPAAGRPSDRTVVLCPGEAGGGADGGRVAALSLVADTPGNAGNAGNAEGGPAVTGLHAGGYNVLTFDFRGHGDSGGQLVSYGDLERRDVLGAVQWLRRTHPDAARHVVGLGTDTGAAALIEAAADPSPAGQAIEAVAAYAPFDRLDRLAETSVLPVAPPPVAWLVDRVARVPGSTVVAPPPLAWLIRHVAVPVAAVQVGAPLSSFAPADAAAQLWPRPLLVLHGMSDGVVPFARGQAVYDAAAEPRQRLFVVNCDHLQLLQSGYAKQVVKRFLDTAGPVL